LIEKAAATDEVDDFEAVAGLERCFEPGGARGDASVVLDGDTVAFEAEFGDQLVEGGGFGERIEGAGLAIEHKRERHIAL